MSDEQRSKGADGEATLATVHWIVTGYLLALALALPLFRRVVERLGSRRPARSRDPAHSQ